MATRSSDEAGARFPRKVPRGLEVLVKKASVDPAFKKLLLEKRGEAANAIGLRLSDAERSMLEVIPLPQLEGIITHTRVSPKAKPAFLGYAAGAMLAALGIAATTCNDGGGAEYKTISEPKKNAGGRIGDIAESLTGNRFGMGTTGTINGKVFDREGTPLCGAEVFVKDVGLTAITDADGNFEFRDLRPGRYSLKASREDCGRQTIGAIFVGPGCTTSLSFHLDYRPEGLTAGIQPDYPPEGGIKRPGDAIRVNPPAGRK